MKPDDVISYLRGTAPAEVTRRVEEALARDPVERMEFQIIQRAHEALEETDDEAEEETLASGQPAAPELPALSVLRSDSPQAEAPSRPAAERPPENEVPFFRSRPLLALAAVVALCIGLIVLLAPDPRKIAITAGPGRVDARIEELKAKAVRGEEPRIKELPGGKKVVIIKIPAAEAADFYRDLTHKPDLLTRLPREAKNGDPIEFTITVSP